MAYKIIVAFRATSGYVTDPTDGTYCLGEAYPTARTTTGTGLGLNLGWDIDLTTYARDRDSGVAYAPLAGINQQVPADSRTFRMTVPEAGLVAVRVAAGDATNANHAYWDILDSDGTTVLLSQTDQAAGAGEFYDASGVLRTSVADWVSNNVAVNITLSGTDFYFRKNISDPNFNVVAMIELNRTAGSGPAVSTVSSNSASEGSNIVHTVTLSGATSGTTNFAATLAGGTATGGGTDYTSDLASASYSNGVTFSAGNMVVPTAVSSWTVTIPTTSDIVVEGPETYTLTVGGVSGTGTINDLVVFTVNSVDLGSFTGFATFTITASATSGIDRDVNYATTDGTAANGVDYTAVSGTATILAGNLTADFLVPIINTRKPDTDLVTTGWTVTGAADHSAALADNTDTSYTTSPDVTASPGPLKTQMLPTPLAAGTHSRQIRANYTSTPCDVKMSLLNSSDVVQGDSGWVSLTASIADYTLSITTTGSSTRFLFEVRATP